MRTLKQSATGKLSLKDKQDWKKKKDEDTESEETPNKEKGKQYAKTKES